MKKDLQSKARKRYGAGWLRGTSYRENKSGGFESHCYLYFYFFSLFFFSLLSSFLFSLNHFIYVRKLEHRKMHENIEMLIIILHE